jgi:plasmid stabilization system protein ParE
MKTYRVDITELAEQDIREAVRYIAADLKNQTAADHLLSDAADAINSLEEMPLRHALADDEILVERSIRFFSVHNYLVFYAVREERKTVVFERFLYGRHLSERKEKHHVGGLEIEDNQRRRRGGAKRSVQTQIRQFQHY